MTGHVESERSVTFVRNQRSRCSGIPTQQLIEQVRQPLPPQPARYDVDYKRNGVRNLLMICEPKRGWREVMVTKTRNKIDFAALANMCLKQRITQLMAAAQRPIIWSKQNLLSTKEQHWLAVSGQAELKTRTVFPSQHSALFRW
jgi:hypothetical protein